MSTADASRGAGRVIGVESLAGHQDPHQAPRPVANLFDVLSHAEITRWVEVGHEVVVYVLQRRTSYVLDRLAGLVWQCLDGEASLDAILSDIAAAFGAARQTVIDDCLPLISDWLQNGLITVVNHG